MNSLFLKALDCKNKEQRPPIWLMRQAGRYLPEYQQLRSKYSLSELFHTPELATQVTLQPIERFGFDAAILFSDILLVAEGFGLKVLFPEGKAPYIDPPITSAEQIRSLEMCDLKQKFQYTQATIAQLKKTLPVPLIGFCGGPFTVASYLFEKAEKSGESRIKEWIYKDPMHFGMLIDKLTELSIELLYLQIDAGVDAVQIFDSWANILSYPHFLSYVVAPLQKIVAAIQARGIPIILFSRGSSYLYRELSSLQPSAISCDWLRELHLLRQEVPRSVAMQGNLDPQLLLSTPEVVRRETSALLHSMQGEPGFIVNLGHGVLPQTPVENVAALVDTVRNWNVR